MAFQQNPTVTAFSQVGQPMYFDQHSQFIQPGTLTSQLQQTNMVPHIQPNYTYSAHQMMPLQIPQYSVTPSMSTTSKEEEWKLVESRKRSRDSPDASSRAFKQTILKDYWLNSPTTTSNRFEKLNDETDEETQSSQTQNDKQQHNKPPPIFVAGVKYIKPLTDLLQLTAKDHYELKVLGDDQVKIQCDSPENYNKIIKALDEKETQYHTYQAKNERSFRVVLRNIHPTVNTQELKEEIEKLGHTVTNISNIKQRISRKPLPLFHIELKQNPNNKDIYNVDRLMNLIVKFEAPHPKREVVQCIRCQRYGHTQKFCSRNPRCVKCAGDHLTNQCQRRTKSNDVKCVLCDGNHPANYKGCIVYKEIQKRKFPTLRPKTNTAQPENNKTGRSLNPPNTYAQVINKQQAIPPNLTVQNPTQIMLQHQEPTGSKLESMMLKLMERMDTVLNLLTTLISKM